MSSRGKATKPEKWQREEKALRAVQVAFDVEEAVIEAVRVAAFHANVSTSAQIRLVLGLPVPKRKPQRPRLTVTLSPADYDILALRYGLDAGDRLAIKEKVTQELVDFVSADASARHVEKHGIQADNDSDNRQKEQ